MIEKPDMEKVVDDIDQRYGINLMKSHDDRLNRDEYKIKVGNNEISIREGRFNSSVHNNEFYIAVDTNNKKELSGSSCPCRSLDDVFFHLERAGLNPVDSVQLRLF